MSHYTFPDGSVGIDYTPGTFSVVTPQPTISARAREPIRKVVLLKDLDRTKISGSFNVFCYAQVFRILIPHLALILAHTQVEGQERKLIGKRSIFQPRRPEICDRCNENPLAKFIFLVRGTFNKYKR